MSFSQTKMCFPHTHTAMVHTHTHFYARLDTLYVAVYSTERHTNTHNGQGIQKFTPRRHCDWLKRQSQRATHTHTHTLSRSLSVCVLALILPKLSLSLSFSLRTNNNACRGSAAPGKTITEIVCPLCAKNQCNF